MVDIDGPLPYIILVCLLLLSGLFAATESAFSYCNRHHIKVLAEDGNKRAKITQKILNKYDNSLIAILIGNNVFHVAISVLSTVLVINLMKNSSRDLASLLSTLVVTLIVFLFGETIPKNIGIANADSWALNSSFFLYILIIITYPIALFFRGLITLVRLIIKDKNNEEAFTEDDFQDVVEKIEEEGVLDEEESDIIQNAVDFGDILVKDILTKKEDIIALDIKKCSHKYVQQFLLEHNYSRIPVYEDSIDNIIGVLHVRTYLREIFKHRNVSFKAVLSKPYFVDATLSLDEIFEGFKKHKTHIALVKNKNKLIGMVTMKDVLEELVGEIDEAGTSPEEEGEIHA